MPNKKRGRPATENPKTVRVDVRLTIEDLSKLNEYGNKKGVPRPQGLRDGIHALNEE